MIDLQGTVISKSAWPDLSERKPELIGAMGIAIQKSFESIEAELDLSDDIARLGTNATGASYITISPNDFVQKNCF